MLPDGSINPGQMTSFNHYALGAVAHFLHTVVGGLAPNSAPLSDPKAQAGWKQAIIHPQPGGTITNAKTSYLSPYGLFRCEWIIENGQFKVEVEVPPNATAKVILPGMEEVVGSGVSKFEVQWEEDKRWPPKAIPGPSSVQAKDEYIP
jgi:alpha-L-rhamnosidase